MAGEDDQNINNQPPNPPPPTQQAPHTVSTIKLPILKKGEYDIWAMKMEHYLAHTDYPVWEVIQNGNGPVSISTDTQGQIKILPPKSAEEILARERERKARTTLLMALPEDHLARFHNISDAKEMWDAIKTRFGGNAWNTGNKEKDNGRRSGKQEDSKALVTLDGEGVDWTSHSEDEQENYAFMACNSSGSDTEVTSCSKECKESYAKLKKLYDEQREQLGDASIEIQAYTQALKKVEAQLVAHQQGQLWYEEKIRFMKIDLDDKTDVLTYHKKLLAEAEKEKEDLKAKVEKWHNSSQNLNILLNSQMSARDKAGLGYGDQMNKSVLSYENEVFQSVFVSRTSDIENSHVNDRYAEGMHVVPPPMTGIYIPSGPETEIDDSQFTYGPKQSKPSESDARSSDFTSCESNTSEETHESMPETVVNEPNVVSQPKVWSDAPIIEEYESDSEDKLYRQYQLMLLGKLIEQQDRQYQQDITGTKSPNTMVDQDYPQRALQNKGIVDNGCSRHMTGNKAYLAEYQDFNGVPLKEYKKQRENSSQWKRAKFLHDTIATQRRILAQQRSEAIRNKPPIKNQFRNQIMTYLKHVGNKKHAELKTKNFDEIKALYEKVKRFDDSFITIGSTEDERKIKEMNEGASDPDKKKKIVKEDVSAKVPAKQDVAEQGTIDSEIMERKSFISKLDKVSSPEGGYLVVYRVNRNFRAFNYLMEVLHIFDRQDLFHLYDLVMKQYSESTPEGIELILWGDLKIMMESSIEVTDQGDFWNDQQDWEIVTWRLYEACGVCILEFKDGTVIHMLVERKYPLSKELLQRMLDFGLEVEVESTAALDLIRVLNSPCFMVKSWLVQDQTVLGKDYSNLLIADSLLKTIWFINAPCYGNEALASPKANGVCCDAEEMRCKFKIESENDILREKLLNVNLLIAKIEALKDNLTPSSDFVTKSSSTSLNFFLEETNTFDNSLPESETFCFNLEEISSGSPTSYLDLSLPDYEAFFCDSEPESGNFTMDVVEDIYDNPTRELYVHVLHDLPTHPTLQLDSDFTLSSDSLGSDLVVSSPSGDRNKIYDPGICIEVESTRSLATLSPVIDNLLPFSSENEDKVFNHGVLASKEKSPPSSSHRGFKASQLFHHKSPMLI
ncbi:hypothetical protein Tco_1360286 [Tanacetum coccineum]